MTRFGNGLLGTLLGAAVALPATADDIDIYRNYAPNPARPPLVMLMVDLSLDVDTGAQPNDVICPDLFTDPACQLIRSTLTIEEFLELLGTTFAAVRNTVLLLTFGLVDLNDFAGDIAQDMIDAVGAATLATAALLNGGSLTLDAVKAVAYTLTRTIRALTDFRVGVMVSHGNAGTQTVSGGQTFACDFADLEAIPGPRASTDACSNGGYVFVGFTDLLNDPLGIAEATLISRVTALVTAALAPGDPDPQIGDPTHPYQGKELYHEFHRYLTGGPIYNGHLGWYDYGDVDPDDNLDVSNPALSWDAAVEDGANYRSAIDDFGDCDIINAINVMTSDSAFDGDSDPAILAEFPGADLNGDGTLTFAELVVYAEDTGFRHNGEPYQIRSRFLVNGADTDASLLQDLGHSVQTTASLVELLVDGASAAELIKTALPIDTSLLTASTTLDASQAAGVLGPALFALFRPTEDTPRWPGNVKKLRSQRNATSGQFEFVDVNGKQAIAGNGRIRTDALTFWTDTGALGGLGADGGNTTAGGAGARIPGATGGDPGAANAEGKRRIFYDQTATALADLDANSVPVAAALQGDLGAADVNEAKELLYHARGWDVGTTANPIPVGTQVRDWLLGAVFHSRPIAINYGQRPGWSSADIRVLFGSQDGLLHMVRNNNPDGSESGVEAWAFMPRAVMGQQKTLRDENTAAPFPYGVDGPVVVYLKDRGPSGAPADGVIDAANPDDRAIAFFGLRRGGSAYYALDITDPDNPALLWRITPSTPGFSRLGLSFSEPVVATLQWDDAGTLRSGPVLIFGGGYDPKKDGENGSGGNVGTDDARGNAIYIVDAVSGALVWKAEPGTFNAADMFDDASRTFSHPLLSDSIPSQVTVLDTTGDGTADRIYVGDTGGRVWRGDFPGADRNSWTLTPVFSIGRHSAGNSVAEDRRFFHRPDYAPTRSAEGNRFDTVLIASGDRADPLNLTTVNYLYAFRDGDTGVGKTPAEVLTSEAAIPGHADFVDITNQCLSAGGACPDDAALATGWKLQLTESGEKGLSTPVTVSGLVLFDSFVPPGASVCEPAEGSTRQYAVSLFTGAPSNIERYLNDGDGDPRSTRGAATGYPGDATPIAADTVVRGAQIETVPARTVYRTFWRERFSDEEQPVVQ